MDQFILAIQTIATATGVVVLSGIVVIGAVKISANVARWGIAQIQAMFPGSSSGDSSGRYVDDGYSMADYDAYYESQMDHPHDYDDPDSMPLTK